MIHVLSRRFALWDGLAGTPVRFAFSIVSADYRDLDGDHDPFPDSAFPASGHGPDAPVASYSAAVAFAAPQGGQE